MALLASKFSYRRLDGKGGLNFYYLARQSSSITLGRRRSWFRFKTKVPIKRKLKIKIPNVKRSLSRKARLIVTAWAKVIRRLKESQSHWGDLFAGNYLFLQVSPNGLKYGDKSFKETDLYALSQRYSVPRIAY